jgi:hypothetical protein
VIAIDEDIVDQFKGEGWIVAVQLSHRCVMRAVSRWFA